MLKFTLILSCIFIGFAAAIEEDPGSTQKVQRKKTVMEDLQSLEQSDYITTLVIVAVLTILALLGRSAWLVVVTLQTGFLVVGDFFAAEQILSTVVSHTVHCACMHAWRPLNRETLRARSILCQ